MDNVTNLKSKKYVSSTSEAVSTFIDVDFVYEKPVYDFFKRIFDFLFSLVGLIILLPFFVIISLIIYIDDPEGSPIYVQQRIGKNGNVFKFYKFRSMRVGSEEAIDKFIQMNEMEGPAFKIKDDPRLTRIGKFIRKCSIDELPQFFNVLKGDLSFCGPRPCLPREFEQYSAIQKQRNLVKPGLTCYWQTTPKRNNLSFDEWLELDFKYIAERSFWIDFKLIIKTVLVMFAGEGV